MSNLENDLLSFYDLRKMKSKEERILNLEVEKAKKDIKLLSRMFCDDVPSLAIELSDGEILIWDSKLKRILYSNKNGVQLVEAAGKATIVRVRPFLRNLVEMARINFVES